LYKRHNRKHVPQPVFLQTVHYGSIRGEEGLTFEKNHEENPKANANGLRVSIEETLL
jgi:hypothetical protein